MTLLVGKADTNEKPLENNKVSAETEQKDHTLFEEKEYNGNILLEIHLCLKNIFFKYLQ